MAGTDPRAAPGTSLRLFGWILFLVGCAVSAGAVAVALTPDVGALAGEPRDLSRMQFATIMTILGGFLALGGLVLIGFGALAAMQAPANRLIEQALAADAPTGDGAAGAAPAGGGTLRLSEADIVDRRD